LDLSYKNGRGLKTSLLNFGILIQIIFLS